MQTGKNATASAKEAAANVAASAKSGMDKTKANVDEKVYMVFFFFCLTVKINLCFFIFQGFAPLRLVKIFSIYYWYKDNVVWWVITYSLL